MNKAQQSRNDLEQCVAPLICSISGARSVIVEAAPYIVATDLDISAGIDWYMCFDRAPTLTFASRIQWRHYGDSSASWAYGATPMTWTIRARSGHGETWVELAKREAAIEYGGLYPYWTVQAYLERPGGDIENLAFCRTDALYAHIRRYRELGVDLPLKWNPEDGSMFVPIKWIHVNSFQYRRASVDPALSQPTLFAEHYD